MTPKQSAKLVVIITFLAILAGFVLFNPRSIASSADKAPPRAPRDFTIETLDAGLKISWQENSEDDIFSYQIKLINSRDQSARTELVGRRSQALISNLENGVVYQVSLSALDRSLNSGEFTKPITIAPEKSQSPRQYHMSAWLTTNEDTVSARAAYENNRDLYDTVSPFWYNQEMDGALTTKGGARDAQLINDLRANKILVIPTITNNYNAGNKTGVMLANQTARERHLNEIINEATANNYDGIDLDYENVNPADKDGFTAFVKELAEKLHQRGKQIIVTSQAKRADGNNWPGVGAMDYSVLGQLVDEFRIMTYDFSRTNTAPGPIAPPDWILQATRYAKSRMPAEKVVIGLPFYGYDWCVSGNCKNSGIVWRRAQEIIDKRGAKVEWDSGGQEPWFLYLDDDYNTNVVYFQNARSLEAKIETVTKENVKGIVIWRLGSEDPQIFDVIRDSLGKRAEKVSGLLVKAGDRMVQLSWQSPVRVTASAYEVLVKNEGGEKTYNVGGETSLTVSELANDSAQEIKIRALDANGQEVASSQTITATPNDLDFPSAINDLKTEKVAADKIALSWSASFDNQSSGSAEKYEIRYSQSPLTAENFADAEIYPHSPKPAAGGQKEYWELRDLTPDTSFYVGIKSFDEAENISDLSNVINAKTIDIVPPAVPSQTKVTPLDSALRIEWSKSTAVDLTSYQVFYQQNELMVFAGQTNKENSSLVVSDLKNGENYDLFLSTNDDDGNQSERLAIGEFAPQKPNWVNKTSASLIEFFKPSERIAIWLLIIIVSAFCSITIINVGFRNYQTTSKTSWLLPRPVFFPFVQTSKTDSLFVRYSKEAPPAEIVKFSKKTMRKLDL